MSVADESFGAVVRAYLDRPLEAPDVTSAADWEALREYQVRLHAICAYFGASRPTVERWAQGRGPHPAMKPAVLEWIAERGALAKREALS